MISCRKLDGRDEPIVTEDMDGILEESFEAIYCELDLHHGH